MGGCSSTPFHSSGYGEMGVCKFCQERSKRPLTPYNPEIVRWMEFREDWCHRSCFEKYRQDHELYVREKEHFGKLKWKLFPRVSHAPSLATIESEISYRNGDNFKLTPSMEMEIARLHPGMPSTPTTHSPETKLFQ